MWGPKKGQKWVKNVASRQQSSIFWDLWHWLRLAWATPWLHGAPTALGVSALGQFEEWKSQKVGDCRRMGCPPKPFCKGGLKLISVVIPSLTPYLWPCVRIHNTIRPLCAPVPCFGLDCQPFCPSPIAPSAAVCNIGSVVPPSAVVFLCAALLALERVLKQPQCTDLVARLITAPQPCPCGSPPDGVRRWNTNPHSKSVTKTRSNFPIRWRGRPRACCPAHRRGAAVPHRPAEMAC